MGALSADSDFKLLARLGEGATSTVDLVEALVSRGGIREGNRYALKRFKEHFLKGPHGEELRERTRREFDSVAQIRHPHLVEYLHAELEHEPYFYVMEYAGELDLVAWRSRTTVSTELVKRVALAVLDGVQCLHEHGILHRDIKPQNIVWGDHGPRLCDFGVIKPTHHDTMTESGTFLGTIRYASPEYLMSGQYDRACDFYSLGAVIHHIYHGADLVPEVGTFAAQVLAVYEGAYKPRDPRSSDQGSESEDAVIEWIIGALLRREKRLTNPDAIRTLIGFTNIHWRFALALIEAAEGLDPAEWASGGLLLRAKQTLSCEFRAFEPEVETFLDEHWDAPDAVPNSRIDPQISEIIGGVHETCLRVWGESASITKSLAAYCQDASRVADRVFAVLTLASEYRGEDGEHLLLAGPDSQLEELLASHCAFRLGAISGSEHSRLIGLVHEAIYDFRGAFFDQGDPGDDEVYRGLFGLIEQLQAE